MTKHQLKQSLHELSPSQEQKQQMLRQIRQANTQNNTRTGWLWRVSSVVVLLAIAIGLWQLEPFLERVAPSADKAAAPAEADNQTEIMVADEPVESPKMEPAEESAAFTSAFSPAEFEREMAETPWQADRLPDSLPVFMPGPEETTRARQTITASEPYSDQEYSTAIVDYSVYRVLEETQEHLSLAVTDQVEIISFDEAKDRLLSQLPAVTKQDIIAGYLTYSRLDESTLIHPIYRFKYRLEGQEDYSFVDARR